MQGYFNAEVLGQKAKYLVPIKISIESLCFAGEDEDGPEEVHEDDVDKGVVVDCLLNGHSSLPQHSEKLHQQLFELQIIVHLGRIVGEEHELKTLIIYYLLHLLNVRFKVYVLLLKT